MLCQNCGKSIVDAARFCSFCGAQQRVESSSQPASGETSARSSVRDDAFEASDVTVILPRRRANSLVEQVAQHANEPPPVSPASKTMLDMPAAHRSSGPAIRIGGAAAIVIIAVLVAAAFHANRPATPAAEVASAPASPTQPMPAPAANPTQRGEPDGGSRGPETPTIASMDVANAVGDAATATTPSAPEATPLADVPVHRVAPPKESAPRKKARAPSSPAAESAPPENPPPPPVEIAAPPPTPVTPSPTVEFVKVEKVACADSANPFSRELCLWQECAKPEYRSHAECSRFAGPGGQR
jgi:zinc-ribbon domain